MKRSMILAAALVVASFAWAEGAQETATAVDEVSLTGVLSFDADGNTLLTAEGEAYVLIVPRLSGVDLDVEAGDTITVTGAPVPGWRGDFRVSSAVIDGKLFDHDIAAEECPLDEPMPARERGFGRRGGQNRGQNRGFGRG